MPTDNQPHRVHRHRAYELAFIEWFSALPLTEQNRLRALGLDKPVEEQFGPVRDDGDERQAPEAGIVSHPVDSLEAAVEAESEIATAFGSALTWCAKANNLVEMGRRLLAVLHVWRPSLVAGLAQAIERQLANEFRDEVGGGDDQGGSVLGPVLEWARRGTSLSQLGQRLLAMAYVLRPALIGGKTLAAIGGLTGKTRQAVDKLVQDFRDTFGGVKSRNMRPEQNRLVCRNAQLRRA